jgi:predicted DNA-binding transcriptional regulator AlpA
MRINRRMACAVLNVTQARFKQLIDKGVVPDGRGLGPRLLTWDEDEIRAIRDRTTIRAKDVAHAA